MLDRLAEAGLEIAIALERRAQAAAAAPADEPVDLDAVALAYARVSRAVRLAILMQSKLVADQDARRARAEGADERELWTLEEAEKDRAARIVRRVIEAEHDDIDRIERLTAEAVERLEDDDCYGAALERPLSDLVADICADLGLNPDWTRLAKEAWAVEELQNGQVGEFLTPYLPRLRQQSAGGGPPAAERVVEGAGGAQRASSSPRDSY